MSWLLLGAVAVVTYGSRALGFLALPPVEGRWRRMLEALPVPLFASLAALPLVVDGDLAPIAVLAAVAGAVVAVLVRRTLLVALLGGLVGYGLGMLVG